LAQELKRVDPVIRSNQSEKPPLWKIDLARLVFMNQDQCRMMAPPNRNVFKAQIDEQSICSMERRRRDGMSSVVCR
jgi:hypothetical protein